jgi:hypothetical protein
MRRTSVCSVADDEDTARVETRQGLGGEVEETPLISMISYPCLSIQFVWSLE